MTAIYVRPMSYMTEPRFVSIIVTDQEALALNQAVQIHASKMIFYREQKPELSEAFQRGKHLIFATNENPIDYLLHSIPGVSDRDREFERMLDRLGTKH